MKSFVVFGKNFFRPFLKELIVVDLTNLGSNRHLQQNCGGAKQRENHVIHSLFTK
jgi:hypothetical protein